MKGQVIAEKYESIVCRVHHKKVIGPIDMPSLSIVFSQLESPSVLGGNSAKKDADKFSYWAACPKEIFELRADQTEAFAKLQTALDKYKLDETFSGIFPSGMFIGGWIGYFSYELGRHIERLPETTIDDLAMPLIRICLYDRVIAYDHSENNFWLIALELPDDIEKPEEKIAGLEKLVKGAKAVSVSRPRPAELDDIDISKIKCNMDRDYYLATVEKIKRYIYDGDVYQVNFSQRFECEYTEKAIELFHWQNHYNPSGYAAFIGAEDFSIVSASPEMFITLADGCISTKPIKGTRKRVNKDNVTAKQINTENFDALLKSEKEQAELNMIIDLERNDLARICKHGTRKVTQQRKIESYPTVFHAVATVAGQLQDKILFCDILRAMFPGGSITGAPKVSSMEIIDQTEPTARGVYTGSIGFIGIDGSVCLNIAIRTIIIKDQNAFVQTGGGIVADSDPQAEWAETITKARALLAGIKAVNESN